MPIGHQCELEALRFVHRRPLLNMIDRYASRFADEQSVVNRFLNLVETHEDCFDRTCRPGHVTGSAWVLSADRRRCLLVHHKKLNRWIQPGGHADGDPDVLAVALREATEETGLDRLELLPADGDPVPLDLDIHVIPARVDSTGKEIEDAHEHHDVRFLLAATVEANPVVSDESHDVRWFLPSEIERLTDEVSVLRLLQKASRWMS